MSLEKFVDLFNQAGHLQEQMAEALTGAIEEFNEAFDAQDELEAYKKQNAEMEAALVEHVDTVTKAIEQRRFYEKQCDQLRINLNTALNEKNRMETELKALRKIDSKTLLRQNKKLREDRDTLKADKATLSEQLKKAREVLRELRGKKEDEGILTVHQNEAEGEILRLVPRLAWEDNNPDGYVPHVPIVECYYRDNGYMVQGYLCDDGRMVFAKAHKDLPSMETIRVAANRIVEYAKRNKVKLPKGLEKRIAERQLESESDE